MDMQQGLFGALAPQPTQQPQMPQQGGGDQAMMAELQDLQMRLAKFGLMAVPMEQQPMPQGQMPPVKGY